MEQCYQMGLSTSTGTLFSASAHTVHAPEPFGWIPGVLLLTRRMSSCYFELGMIGYNKDTQMCSVEMQATKAFSLTRVVGASTNAQDVAVG
jgi:hypothetical protein